MLNEGGKKQDLDSESEEDPNEERLKNEEDREDIKDYYQDALMYRYDEEWMSKEDSM